MVWVVGVMRGSGYDDASGGVVDVDGCNPTFDSEFTVDSCCSLLFYSALSYSHYISLTLSSSYRLPKITDIFFLVINGRVTCVS